MATGDRCARCCLLLTCRSTSPRSARGIGADRRTGRRLARQCLPAEHAEAFLEPLRTGATKSGTEARGDLDLVMPVAVEFTDDVEEAASRHARGYAFTIGAMGSKDQNFYNAAFARQGFGDDVEAVQALWLAGRREEAAARVPLDIGLKTNLLGTPRMIANRIRLYRQAGITTLQPAGRRRDATPGHLAQRSTSPTMPKRRRRDSSGVGLLLDEHEPVAGVVRRYGLDPYGRSAGSWMNSTPWWLSSLYVVWQSSVARPTAPRVPLPASAERLGRLLVQRASGLHERELELGMIVVAHGDTSVAAPIVTSIASSKPSLSM